VRVFPDGSKSTLEIERTEFRADGAMVLTAEDGTRTVIAADGSIARDFADGTKSRLTIEKPPEPATPAVPLPEPTPDADAAAQADA
jgi:hypothetical protein